MKRIALFSLLLASCAMLHAGVAEDILAQSGVKGGIVVHVGCGDGSVTQKLRANDSYQIQGLTKEGLSCFMYTGSYAVPPPTLTGTVMKDLCLIPHVLGLGEVRE